MESVERIGRVTGGSGKFGREDWWFREGVDDNFTIGIVGLFVGGKNGDVGADVQDCVGR